MIQLMTPETYALSMTVLSAAGVVAFFVGWWVGGVWAYRFHKTRRDVLWRQVADLRESMTRQASKWETLATRDQSVDQADPDDETPRDLLQPVRDAYLPDPLNTRPATNTEARRRISEAYGHPEVHVTSLPLLAPKVDARRRVLGDADKLDIARHPDLFKHRVKHSPYARRDLETAERQADELVVDDEEPGSEDTP